MYVSAAFDRLYPGGVGFPESADRANAGWIRDDAAGAGIAFVADLFAGAPYGVTFDPAIFAEDTPWTRALWPLYSSMAHKVATGSVVVAIDDALTFGSVLYAGHRHGRPIIYETHRPNDRAVAQLAPPALVQASRPHDFGDDADYLFLGSVGSFNYGHFLVDDLPRLKAVETLRATNDGRRVVVVMNSHGPAIDRVRASAVRRIAGQTTDIRFLPLAEAFRFKRLYFATPVSSHPIEKNPLALDYVVQAVGAATGIVQDPRLKLLVLRKSSSVRALQNQADLVARLKPLGFETVHPEDLSFEAQVRRFAEAAVIVGQMGASMTNTIFASATAHLVYLAPAGWIEPFYWDLALARGQHYQAVYGKVMTPDRLISEAEFVVSPDAVLAALATPQPAPVTASQAG